MIHICRYSVMARFLVEYHRSAAILVQVAEVSWHACYSVVQSMCTCLLLHSVERINAKKARTESFFRSSLVLCCSHCWRNNRELTIRPFILRGVIARYEYDESNRWVLSKHLKRSVEFQPSAVSMVKARCRGCRKAFSDASCFAFHANEMNVPGRMWHATVFFPVRFSQKAQLTTYLDGRCGRWSQLDL